MSPLDGATLFLLWALLAATGFAFARAGGIWSRLALYASFSQKGALLLLAWSCWRGEAPMVPVAVLLLLVGGISVLVLGLFLARGQG